MNRDPGCCAVVPGTTMLGLVALPAATTPIPIFVTTSTVFGWCAVLPGLCSALLFSAFVLFSLVSTLCRPLGARFKISKMVFHRLACSLPERGGNDRFTRFNSAILGRPRNVVWLLITGFEIVPPIWELRVGLYRIFYRRGRFKKCTEIYPILAPAQRTLCTLSVSPAAPNALLKPEV